MRSFFDINIILQQTVHSGAVHSDGTRKIHLQKENVFKIFFPGAFGKVGRVRHSSPFNDKISIQRSVKRCLRKEILLKDVCTKKYYKFVDFFFAIVFKIQNIWIKGFSFYTCLSNAMILFYLIFVDGGLLALSWPQSWPFPHLEIPANCPVCATSELEEL